MKLSRPLKIYFCGWLSFVWLPTWFVFKAFLSNARSGSWWGMNLKINLKFSSSNSDFLWVDNKINYNRKTRFTFIRNFVKTYMKTICYKFIIVSSHVVIFELKFVKQFLLLSTVMYVKAWALKAAESPVDGFKTQHSFLLMSLEILKINFYKFPRTTFPLFHICNKFCGYMITWGRSSPVGRAVVTKLRQRGQSLESRRKTAVFNKGAPNVLYYGGGERETSCFN